MTTQSAAPEEFLQPALPRMLDVPIAGSEPAFDALAQTVSAVCACPFAWMSLIDGDQEWLEAGVGIDAIGIPRSEVFHALAPGSDALLEVDDALDDRRFAWNPLVTGEPGIRFYAAQPIVFDGVVLGALCVADRVSRRLTDLQRAVLARLAVVAGELFDGRRATRSHERDARRLRRFAALSGDWLWECDLMHRCTWVSGDAQSVSGLFYEALPIRRFRDAPVLDWVGRQTSRGGLLGLLQAGMAFSQVVVETITCEGRRFIALAGEPMIDGEGRLTGFRGSARDITSRLDAEIALRARESAFRKLAAQVPGALYQLMRLPDGSSRFPYASEAFCDVFEVTADAAMADASNVFRTVHPDDVDDVVASVVLSRTSGTIWHARFRVQLPEKGLRWLQGSSSPEQLPDGSTLWHGYITDVTESHARDRDLARAHAKLETSERWLRALTDNLPALVTHVDVDERYTFVNARFARALGCDAEQMLGRTILEIRGEAVHRRVDPYVRRVMGGEIVSFDGFTDIGGHTLYYESTYVPDLDADGNCLGFYAMSLDVTDRRQAELRLAANEQLLRDITDNLPVLISHMDADERMTYANDTFLQSVGLTRGCVIGHPARDAFGALYPERRDHIRRCLAGERVAFDLQSVIGAATRHLQATYLPEVGKDGRVVGITTLCIDVTDLKVAQMRLSQLAHFDQLTGLPNRLQFNNKIAEMIADDGADGLRRAIMFLDLDHFKAINDAHGHGVGDGVLQVFGGRIRDSIRSSDFVARLAGDEFVVILGSLDGVAQAERIARNILRRVEQPFSVNGCRLAVTTCIGIAMRDADTHDASTIMARADGALYRAKDAGRNTYRFAASGARRSVTLRDRTVRTDPD